MAPVKKPANIIKKTYLFQKIYSFFTLIYFLIIPYLYQGMIVNNFYLLSIYRVASLAAEPA